MSLPNYKIPLFDIDWTLLIGENSVHKAGFNIAIHNIYKLPNASFDDITPHGMIDTQILIEIAKLHGVSEEEAVKKVPEAMLTMIDYYMKHAQEADYTLMPGALDLLGELKKLGIPLGLLTGNIEEVGWEKVRRAGIKDFFMFGAFGSLAFKRIDLIPIAKKRLEKMLNIEMPLERFVIVGDSPLDIACARAGNIEVIAVGAGHYKSHELSHADLTVDSLKEKNKIIEFLSTS